MEKVIAIMNKPIDCQCCPFSICKYSLPLTTNKVGYVCSLDEDRIVEEFDYLEEIHLKNCPLKPIPKEDNSWCDDEYYDGWTTGYNACLKKILGNETNF